jgi:hypothetical protein
VGDGSELFGLVQSDRYFGEVEWSDLSECSVASRGLEKLGMNVLGITPEFDEWQDGGGCDLDWEPAVKPD